MKFFHVADLHFGKTLHNVSLIEEDQPFWVVSKIDAVKVPKVNALITYVKKIIAQ